MKKLVWLIVAVLLLGMLTWLQVQDSHVSVYVDFNPDTPNSTIQEAQEQFKVGTADRLNLECTDGYCHGVYTADNFIQLVHYQNNLFNTSEAENLVFSSFVDGSFFAKWLD